MTSLVLKATERCNSRCRYCVERSDAPRHMSEELLAVLFAQVDDLLRRDPGEEVEVLWHGGEPLVRGPRFFESVRRIEAEACPSTRSRIHHAVQTNATCLGERMLDALRALRVSSVGTSFEPLEGIRGPGGPFAERRQRGLFLRGVSRLERHGIRWGIIWVATRAALGRGAGILTFLGNLAPTGAITVNPVVGCDDPALALEPAEYVGLLAEMFPVWWRARRRFPPVQPFSALVDLLARPTPPEPVRGEAPMREIVVDPEGGVTSARGRWPAGAEAIGSVLEAPLGDLLRAAEARLRERELRTWEDERCRRCRLWPVCRGGCAMDPMSLVAGVPAESEWCHARRHLFHDVVEPAAARA